MSVSRLVREGIETRFGQLFNDAVEAGCVAYGLDPALVFAVNFAEDNQGPNNFFRGDWSLDQMRQFQEPEWPAVTIWTGEIQDQKMQKPRLFSGAVAAYWRFWLVIPGMRRAGLVDLREAVEGAMLTTLDPEFTGGIGYRGDLAGSPLGEQSILDQDERHFGWIQEVNYTCSFEVNI